MYLKLLVCASYTLLYCFVGVLRSSFVVLSLNGAILHAGDMTQV
uniref:Uncharacterized protein n=1 Tax=Anguilla anguilla TaxID=7936 RepID=A0A0E9TIW0_ANGAN